MSTFLNDLRYALGSIRRQLLYTSRSSCYGGAGRRGQHRGILGPWVGLGLIGWMACGSGEVAPTSTDLEGAWCADLLHNGQRSPFGLEFESDSTGQLSASISVPALEVRRVPIGSVRTVGDTIIAGFLTLVYERSGPKLVGKLPAALVPVHEISLQLRPTGRLEFPVDTSGFIPPAEPAWVYSAGAPVWAGIAVSQGTAFAADDGGVVHAIDLVTGATRWKVSTAGAIRAAPVTHEGAVFVHSDDGFLYRLDARTGRLEWKTAVADSATKRVAFGASGFRYDQYASAPAIAAGRLFVGHADGILRAFDLETGEKQWSFSTTGPITATPAVLGEYVFFGSFDGNVYALEAATGATVWRYDTGAAVSSSAGLFEDYVIVGSRSYDLMALGTEDGEPAWTYYYWFSWVESSPTIRDGVVYIGSSDAQRLNALDGATGRPLWVFDTGGSAWSSPAVSDDAVFIGAVGVADYFVGHRAGFFGVDRETGRGLWRFDMPRPDTARVWGFASSPAASGGRVVAAGLDGRIYGFHETRDGESSRPSHPGASRSPSLGVSCPD
jgi:outer membrane protein assembly factor BamB